MEIQKILNEATKQIEKMIEDKLKDAKVSSRPRPEGLEVFPDAADVFIFRTGSEKREFRTYLETAVIKGKLACKDSKNCQKYLEEMHAELKKAYKFFNYFS